MKICIDTRSIHPHMAPLAAIVRDLLPESDNLTYVYRSTPNDPNRAMGAKGLVDDIAKYWDGNASGVARDTVLLSDVLIENHRDFCLIEERLRNSRLTIYQSERWFKPINVGVLLPGFLRMLFPFGIKRAIKMMRLFRAGKYFYYFPLGEHAARDMARMCGLMNGDWKCLFRAPAIDFERKPCGRIWLRGGGDESKYCLDKMRMWGYFVLKSKDECSDCAHLKGRDALRLLWVGRMLALKNVDVIIKAVRKLEKVNTNASSQSAITLDIYGNGPDEKRLKRLARGCERYIRFHPSAPYEEIRKIMHEHNVYVFCSNALEGWGAVLNEALEEGMKVVSSSDAGAATVLLPKECLFKARDVNHLEELLRSPIPKVGIGVWSVESAARNLIDFMGDVV